MIARSEVWSCFQNTASLEEFKEKFIGDLFIHPSIPDEIKSQLQQVEKILLHSYFEYSFLDIALLHSVFILEKAIKLKWQNGNEEKKEKDFKKLIEWGLRNKYFETENEGLIKQLREIRNGKVHEIRPDLGGVAYLDKVRTVFDLINDLYEDHSLRINRFLIHDNLDKVLFRIIKKGAYLEYYKQRFILYKAYPIFVSNKFNPIQAHIVCYPIFDLNEFQKNQNRLPSIIQLNITNWSLHNNEIKAIEVETGYHICIHAISDKGIQENLDKWLNELKALSDFNSFEFLDTIEIEEEYLRIYRAHQKIQIV